MKDFWQEEIRKEIERQGKVGVDARHVEAYMRTQNPSFNSLTSEEFRYEVAISIRCVELTSKGGSEILVQSWGL